MIPIKPEYLEWMASSDTGLSSKTILCSICGIDNDNPSVPADASDVGRCVRLLNKFPELRDHLYMVYERHVKWMPYIDCWQEIEYLHRMAFFSTSHDKFLYHLLNKLSFASNYLSGLRIQNYSNSWANKSPDKVEPKQQHNQPF